jgi:hypothetical protein
MYIHLADTSGDRGQYICAANERFRGGCCLMFIVILKKNFQYGGMNF